jgi:hypothetical protein
MTRTLAEWPSSTTSSSYSIPAPDGGDDPELGKMGRIE